MDVRLIVWGVFGGLGFAFFLLLVELLRRFGGRDIVTGALIHLKRASAATADELVPPPAPTLSQILRDFSCDQLSRATNGFAQENLLREGVFAGSLEPGAEAVLVQRAAGAEDFEAEVAMLSGLGRSGRAQRFVQILGSARCCSCPDQQDDHFLVVLRQTAHGDLAAALRRGDDLKSSDGDSSETSDSSASSSKPLDWITRFKIAIGAAEALAFLHHDCSPAVIHRDVRSSSVFLDEGYEVRLGSFGKACRQQYGGEVLPSYDVHCYGKVLLDLVSGLDISGGGDGVGEAWLRKALPLMEFARRDALLRLVDPALVLDEDHVKELLLVAVIAKSCLDPGRVQRQTMANILSMLQNPAFFLALAGQG